MALSNRDRVGKMLEILARELEPFIAETVASDLAPGQTWTSLVAARDALKGIEGKTYEATDPQVQLRILTENITGALKPGWYPFNARLSRVQESYASELRDVRDAWAHHKPFSDDDAYRALDTAERLLLAVHAAPAADEVAKVRLNLRRVTAARDDSRVLKAAAADNPESTGLRPWREVLQPHPDVATGNFQASEFAADLFKVSRGEGGDDYADPVQFFRRTYLTEGLRELIGGAVRRLAGDDNAAPVINLQTNFGGGKTHSMLSLWHLAGRTPLDAYPQSVQELLAENHFAALDGTEIRRVAIVGNHFAATGETKPDGTHVRTIWGELAWQLGGRAAYAMVSEADATSTPPGAALHDLLAAYSPAVILIDEWVSYARTLHAVDAGPNSRITGGTFDDQFTFAHSLTEAVKGTTGVILAISIPASESNDGSGEAAGIAEEVGGSHGFEALARLQNVVRRVAQPWRHASSTEAYHIVRQRLFVTPDAASLASIGATARAFVEMYRKHDADFPRESRDSAYEERIKATYPIHPELFDRLYEGWSTLERFQRTRGVLRLMNAVIHALWVGEDASPLIMPGSLPIAVSAVNRELAQYLNDNWKSVIDTDVDGAGSTPARLDVERTQFGTRSLTKRLARTVFFGAVPTIGSAHKGIETQRVFLGTAVSGDRPGDFHAALNALGDRATYFYAGAGKYWYDLQANITRTAKDQAERLHIEDVRAEIVKRLQGQARTRGDFAGVHVCPESNSDIPDLDETRLVLLHPKVAHKRGEDSEAKTFARQATEHRGTSHRTHRNAVVFLAADAARLGELEAATRDFLGWSHVLTHEADLDLTQTQRNQAVSRRSQADETVQSRLLQTFTWALVPSQPDPGAPFVIRETKVEGQAESLAERVSRRLGNDGDLSTRQAAATIRLALRNVDRIWERGHVSLGTLWSIYSQYPYMPRLRDRSVLASGVSDMPLLWQTDAYALASGYDEAGDRYVGLWAIGDAGSPPAATDSLLLVRPDVAEAQRSRDSAQALALAGQAAVAASAGVSTRHTVGVEAGAEVPVRAAKTRFYGVKTLSSDSLARDFKSIADEVITHFQFQEGTHLVVRLEIEATDSKGFTEAKVRTVSENAATLKFDQSGFEDS